MTPLDYQQALNRFIVAVNGNPNVDAGGHLFAQSGDAIVFMCNHDGRGQPADGGELVGALQVVGGKCLGYLGGE